MLDGQDMRKPYILLFSIFPAILVAMAIFLLWQSHVDEQHLRNREAAYSELEARGKAIDAAANMSVEASHSASAFVRIIRSYGVKDRALVGLFDLLARVLLSVAFLQVLAIIFVARRFRSSNSSPQTDAPTPGAPLS